MLGNQMQSLSWTFSFSCDLNISKSLVVELTSTVLVIHLFLGWKSDDMEGNNEMRRGEPPGIVT